MFSISSNTQKYSKKKGKLKKKKYTFCLKSHAQPDILVNAPLRTGCGLGCQREAVGAK